MTQQSKVGRHKTIVRNDADELSVVYHSTEVVKATADRIVLNTGGWLTATTKARMNQASQEFGLGYSVYQVNGRWFVDYNGVTFQIQDVLVLPR